MLGQSGCFQEPARPVDVSQSVSDTVGDREDGFEAHRYFTTPLFSGVGQVGIRSIFLLKRRDLGLAVLGKEVIQCLGE